jgi:hypothetical protein
MAVTHQVEAAVEVGEVKQIDRALRLLVPAVGVVALANGPVVEKRGLEYRDELGDRHLQLGPQRAHADRLAHSVEEADGILAKNAADLLEGGADRWAEDAGAERGPKVAAHDERGDLGQGQLQGHTDTEFRGEPPESPVAVGGLLVVEREARVLQHAGVAPDGAPAVAAELPGGIIDRDARRALDELEQTPLPRKKVAAGHRRSPIVLGGRETVNGVRRDILARPFAG